MPAEQLIDADLVERFRVDLERLCPDNAPLALAVSGGPDSMAMLALTHAAVPSRPRVATVDHGLRPASRAEAELVAGWCADRGILHATLTVATPPGATGNLQGWARRERYLLLKRWAIAQGATALATAHHADDQAETFLMRAARGSGLSGLTAIRARLDEEVPFSGSGLVPDDDGWGFTVGDGALATVRPLLGWRRTDLRALCVAQGVPFVDDSSNEDDRFDRTRFRNWLAAAPWLDPVAIGKSVGHLAEADRDLRDVSQWLHARRRVDGGNSPREDAIDVAALPRGVRRLMARTCIDFVRGQNGIKAPAWSSGTSIEPLLDALEAGRTATQAGVLVEPRGTVWRFREQPPRRTG